jgi:hypothetical protein
MTTTRTYLVKLSGGCRAEGSPVDGEYGGEGEDARSLILARESARWFAENVVGGSIRIVTPINHGMAVQTVEVIR